MNLMSKTHKKLFVDICFLVCVCATIKYLFIRGKKTKLMVFDFNTTAFTDFCQVYCQALLSQVQALLEETQIHPVFV